VTGGRTVVRAHLVLLLPRNKTAPFCFTKQQ